MKKILSILSVCIALSACQTHQTDLTVISNKNISLTDVDLDKAKQTKNVTGEDVKFKFLFIRFGTPRLNEAVNDALNKNNADLLTDASVYTYYWSVLLFGQEGIKITGTAVSTRAGEK